MSKLRALLAALLFLFGWKRAAAERDRIVPRARPAGRAETAVLALLGLATLSAVGFVTVYAIESIPRQTQFLGLTLGLALAFLAGACVVVARRILPDEEIEHDYPPLEHEPEQGEIVRIVDESKDAFTRRRLLGVAAGGAGVALGAALVTPVFSLGPFLDTDLLYASPWSRGRRLVDEHGRPVRAREIEEGAFYTAFPEGADREDVAAPLVVVRLSPAALRLPEGRAGWAPQGILAYSKICTHAGCAVALYRTPLYPPTEPKPALVCPCHYSTFDPATGGTVLFGPAGRPLPQLPVAIDERGFLRAAGGFSAPVGPSWWGVRKK
jgi:ubiquinol-cytochrome c reductase iron-sulfur subunit